MRLSLCFRINGHQNDGAIPVCEFKAKKKTFKISRTAHIDKSMIHKRVLWNSLKPSDNLRFDSIVGHAALFVGAHQYIERCVKSDSVFKTVKLRYVNLGELQSNRVSVERKAKTLCDVYHLNNFHYYCIQIFKRDRWQTFLL